MVGGCEWSGMVERIWRILKFMCVMVREGASVVGSRGLRGLLFAVIAWHFFRVRGCFSSVWEQRQRSERGGDGGGRRHQLASKIGWLLGSLAVTVQVPRKILVQSL